MDSEKARAEQFAERRYAALEAELGAALEATVSQAARAERAERRAGRGLHSSTSQLNLSRF